MRRLLILVGIGAMLFLVVTSLRDIFISNQIESDQNQESEQANLENTQGTPSPITQTEFEEKSAKYLEFSRQNMVQNASVRKVLFFYANWCPTCKPADQDLRENIQKLPSDVVVIRVNYNDDQTDESEKELAKKYKVTYQHTFVQIDQNGEVVTKWNGEGAEKLLSNLK